MGGANDLGRVRADKLDVEFSLSSLMRGEWRATELDINGAAIDFGLDAQGRIDLPTPSGSFNLGTLAIDRLSLTGRVALHDAASRRTLELNDITFSGDVRSLAGAMRGDGNMTLSGTRYPFRVSSGQTGDGNGTRVHLSIDPGERPLSIDLDGVLSFDARAPRFDGGFTVARPVAKPKPGETKSSSDKSSSDKPLPDKPWRVTSRVKADPAIARFEQVEASYGADDAALKLGGSADLRFGASPLLHAILSARQLDADRLFAKEDRTNEPKRLLPELRRVIAAFPPAPLATQIEISTEQIMLGGRPVQTLSADLRGDPSSWSVNRLEFRAPGSSRVMVSGDLARADASGSFRGPVSIDSSDPDTLAAWLQGRNDVSYRSQRPLRVRGMLSVAADRVALDALQAEIDGSTIHGRLAFADSSAVTGSRLDLDLKGDRLDIDATVALVRSLSGPQGEWPASGQLSLDIGRATSAGQEMRPLIAQIGYGPKIISLDRFKVGEATGLMLEGGGAFDRIESTGKLTVSATSSSFKNIADVMTPLAPVVAARLNAMTATPGAASIKLALDLDKDRTRADRANARAVIEIVSPQLKGTITLSAAPMTAALRGLDVGELARSDVAIESRLSAAHGSQLLAALGLDGVIAAGDAPLSFEGSATGTWRTPLRIKAALSGATLDASLQGTVDPWSEPIKAAGTLSISRADIAPLVGLKPSDAPTQTISLSSRVALADGKLSLDDIDSTVGGSRVRGRLALAMGAEKTIDGQIGLDTIELAPAFAFALGVRGHDAMEPIGDGMLQGLRGQLAFQALRGLLPGGGELRPVSGVVKSDGKSFNIEALKGNIGGGEAMLDLDARASLTGLAVNARVQLTNVDGAALHYRALTMPAGRAGLRMTLTSQGRSASALKGALAGNGLLTIEQAKISGLNPQAFDAAIRASDSGVAADDNRLRQIVEPVLSTAPLTIASAQIPFSIQSGRLRVSTTTLEADGARAIVSGGYDIAADQADIRANLISTAPGATVARPELQIFAVGSPDHLDRTVDVAALSSWLAVRAIDRETRRLDSLERGEIPPAVLPTALSPPTLAPAPPGPTRDSSVPSNASTSPDMAAPVREPRRTPFKPAPRPVATPEPAAPPQVSQQVAPLPAPIEIRPAPGSVRTPRPRPAPPLVITPPAANGLR